MKKILTLSILAVTLLTACNGDKLQQAEAENEQLKGDLRETVAAQDSLLSLFNDITEGMNQIKELEKIISNPGTLGETPSRREQIKNDIIAIRQSLQERRERLEQLEKQLAASGNDNTNLKRTITNLRAQIAEQQTEIATLTNQLASANIRIDELSTEVQTLNSDVDSLNTKLTDVSAQKEAADAAANAATVELNTVYIAIGSSKELKEAKILESGFLRKTKVMKGEFNLNYFKPADKRTLTSIPTHSKKAKIITSQPADSYTITDQGGQKVIKITNPSKFWQVSNFLVVEID